MAEDTPEPTEAPVATDPSPSVIDFAQYSTEQLLELRAAFDAGRFPQEHKALEQELARRTSSPYSTGVPTPGFRVEVRFTPHDGIRGWLQARSSKSPLFGAGAMTLHADTVVLSGWSRTWLGVRQPTELAFDLSNITNVVTDGNLVCFTALHRGRRYALSLRAADATQASALAVQLPQQRDPGFREKWAELKSFNHAMLAATPHTYFTTALVAANLLIYLGLLALNLSPLRIYAAQIQGWGVNVGTLTLNGEWWRLVTALFLHANIPHVAFNLWALWNVGRLCERLYGRATFLVLYLLCGVSASMSSIVWDANRFTVGASGAIFGLLGALLAFLTLSRPPVPTQIVRAHRWSTVIFISVNLVAGAFNYTVDNAAHIGGLASGLLLGGLLASGAGKAIIGRLSPARVGAAVAVTLTILVVGHWIARGGSTGTPESYRWRQSHRWYLDHEPANLNAWAELDQAISGGKVSRQSAAKRFASDVLPFWVTANQRLMKEGRVRAPDPLSVALADFVSARLEWARAWLAELKGEGDREGRALEDLMRATLLAQARFSYQSTRQGLADRPYSWSDAPIVARLRAGVAFKAPDCVRDRNALAKPSGAEDSPTDGPARRYAAGCNAQAAFRSAAYATLDSQLTQHAAHLADLEDGSSSFSGDVTGLDDYFEYSGVDATQLLVNLSNWRRAVPGSVYPDLLEAMLYQSIAWQIRGRGYADSVSNEQWQAFSIQLEMAAAAIDNAAPRGKQTPLWYALALWNGLDRDVSPKRLRATFNAGAKQFPGYEGIYRAMLRPLMPRWGGSFEAVEAFIREVADQERLWTPDARYASLYLQYADLEGNETDVFSDVGADWPRLIRGFEALVKRYPRSDVVLNAYLNFACRAHDLERYRSLRPQIDGRRADSVWTTALSVDSCDKELGAGFVPTATAELRPKTDVLWGIRLGVTRIEVERAKGLPVKVDGQVAYYNAAGPGDEALVEIVYGPASEASTQPVRAILYFGDRENAPPELPFIGGMTREQLNARFGPPVWGSSRTGGEDYWQLTGGITVNLRKGKVEEYGIRDASGSP